MPALGAVLGDDVDNMVEHVRGMADGISEALVTTMAGLMTALAGMYFASDLSQRITRETERIAKRLAQDPPPANNGSGAAP